MNKVSLPLPTPILASSILGFWKLKSREDVDAKGNRKVDPILGPDPLGILCFAPGYFAAQFMKRDRSGREQGQQPIQGMNNSSAMNGYDAYFGTYGLDESAGTLTIHLEGSISPSNIGSTFVRDIRVQQLELIIQLATNAVDGTKVTRALIFSRI